MASGAVEVWNTCVEGVKAAADKGLDALKTITTKKLDKVKQAYQNNGGGIKGIVAATMSAVRETYTFGIDFIDELSGGKLTAIRQKFEDLMSGAKEAVSNGIEKIKGFFDFKWSLPKIKMPHFSITGKFSLDPLSVPKFKVSWYKEGGILYGAQLFGMMGRRLLAGGEAGPEAVLPLHSFYDELSRILDRKLNTDNRPTEFKQYNNYNSPKDLSPAECARQTRNNTRKLLAAIGKT